LSDPKAFGKYVRARRDQLDLTQDVFAERVGCTRSTIDKIERGLRRPSRQVAGLMADQFGLQGEERAAFVSWARDETDNLDLSRNGTGVSQATHIQPGEAVGSPATSPELPPHTAPTGNWTPSAAQSDYAYTFGSQLPAQLTSLLGRQEEISKVTSIIRRADVRLLTLLGPPGIGKTRLSLAVAASVESDFGDGAHFINLAPVREPALLSWTIMQSLGIKPGAEVLPPEQALAHALKDKHLLLVLDNFEQLVHAAPLVASLLSWASRIKVIATSREALGVYGEHRYNVPALKVPYGVVSMSETLTTPHLLLTTYSAVALFVQRARAVNSDFELSAQNAEAVARLCAQLDGLPLVIELAAAQADSYTPAEMLAQIAQNESGPAAMGATGRLGLLDVPLRDRTDRQHTLRGAINWSYDLLSAEDRALFRVLATFAGGFSPDAVEAVAVELGIPSARHTLRSLLLKSIIRTTGSPGAPLRYDMLETIREYAAERLDEESNKSAHARHAHAHYFLALAEGYAASRGDHSNLLSSFTAEQHVALAVELDNFRAALAWARSSGAHETLARLVTALSGFWDSRGYWSEARLHLSAALEHREELSARTLAAVLFELGWFAQRQGDTKEGTSRFEESLALLREIGGVPEAETALNQFGSFYLYTGQFDSALELFQQAVELEQNRIPPDRPDEERSALYKANLATTYLFMGNLGRAADLAAFILEGRPGSDWTMAQAGATLGSALLMQRKAVEARPVLVDALRAAWRGQHMLLVLYSLAALAGTLAVQGNIADATRIFTAFEANSGALGLGMPVGFRSFYEQLQALVRGQANAEGLEPPKLDVSTSLEQIVAMVIEEPVTAAVEST
jgi:predicted ATPase/transcriptional regulator with XRE-family HTH domain